MIQVRPNSPWKPEEDVLIDYVIYRCPVRQKQCFALMDNTGLWWTAKGWNAESGYVFTQRGNTMYHEVPECRIRYDNQQLHDVVYEIMERVNGGDRLFTRYTMPRERGLGRMPEPWMKDVIYTSYYSQRHELVDIHTPMFDDRKKWENDFETPYHGYEKKDYSPPTGSVLSSHELSVRCAKVRHVAACRAKRARHLRKQRNTSGLMDTGSITLERWPPDTKPHGHGS